jgi:hypothetical protein
MRRLRDQPRLALARILGAVCLVLVGTAIGSALDRGDTDRVHAAHVRLVTAQRSLAAGRVELRSANGLAARADVDARRARARVRRCARANRRLRHELAAAKRLRLKSKSRAD